MEAETHSFFAGRQVRVILAAFAAFMAILALGYYAFLRTDYAVLYSDLRPADASVILAELEAKNISYKLKNGGATILVPEGDADALRLNIGRSEASEKGMTGFEIFNKSDMGLTDFAQKINYQRALQGELARTILALDDVADARVHLALPERSLFRGNRSQPKAAVTVTTKNGLGLNETRVAGIQRLVAAAVPDLALSDVVVLNELGQVISPAIEVTELSPQMDEEAAAQEYFRARARSAIQQVLPAQSFDVRVLLLSRTGVLDPTPWSKPSELATTVPSNVPGQGEGKPTRNFSLRLSVITPKPLSSEERNLAGNAVADAVALDLPAGDSLQFAVGPVGPTASTVQQSGPVGSDAPSPRSGLGRDDRVGSWFDWLFPMAGVAAIIMIALLLRRPQSNLTLEQRDAFVARIRARLNPTPGEVDARS